MSGSDIADCPACLDTGKVVYATERPCPMCRKPKTPPVSPSKSSDLLPCPFCGDENPEIVEAILTMQPAWIVECQNCCASRKASKRKDYAVKLWNERAR